MAIPFWVDSLGEGVASLWDFLWLGGVLIPGLWSVEIVKARSIDVQKVKGQDAATLTDNGYELATVKMVGRLWREDQVNLMQERLLQFDPIRAGSVKYPLDIYHPAAVMQGVKSIYIKSITVPNPSGGFLQISIDAIEWAKPTATTTSKKAKGFSGADNKNGSALNPEDFSVKKPSGNTGKNL